MSSRAAEAAAASCESPWRLHWRSSGTRFMPGSGQDVDCERCTCCRLILNVLATVEWAVGRTRRASLGEDGVEQHNVSRRRFISYAARARFKQLALLFIANRFASWHFSGFLFALFSSYLLLLLFLLLLFLSCSSPALLPSEIH